MARKTFEVAKVVELANHFFASSPDERVGERKGVAIAVESILHQTGNYKGYGELHWINVGYAEWVKDGEPEDKDKYYGDTSRIVFYT